MEKKLLENGKGSAAPSRLGALLSRFGPWLLLALLLLAPLTLGEATAVVRILDLIAIYCLLALGLNVVVGFAGLLVLG